MSTPQLAEHLLTAALEARACAYAPFSHFHVGAALESDDGRVHVGCNVENASYGLTICAERAAVSAAVAAGARKFRQLIVVSTGGVTPCGACRQVLAEFCADLRILLVDADQPRLVRAVQLDQLLPERFSKTRLASPRPDGT